MEARYPDVIDTHSHVSGSEFDRDRASVIARAEGAGVGFIEVGFDVSSSVKSVALAGAEAIAAAVGIHPHNAADCASDLPEEWKKIEALAKANKRPPVAPSGAGNDDGAGERRALVVAIGEIGLDYYRDLSPRDVQTRCFEMGLDLAKAIGLPVIIHQRDAEKDTLDILRTHKLSLPVLFHCFGGDLSYARQCLDLGGYLGLGGTVTYSKNAELRDLLRFIPIDRILLETDAPYLSPQSRRGHRNEPLYVLETRDIVAAALDLEATSVGRKARDNAVRALSL